MYSEGAVRRTKRVREQLLDLHARLIFRWEPKYKCRLSILYGFPDSETVEIVATATIEGRYAREKKWEYSDVLAALDSTS